MKKNIEKFGDFRIEWKSVLKMGPQGHGLNILFGNRGENLIAFIIGWEWSRKETAQVKVLVLSPRSREWDSLSTDPGQVLEDVKERVRTVLEARDGKLCGKIRKNIYTLGNC